MSRPTHSYVMITSADYLRLKELERRIRGVRFMKLKDIKSKLLKDYTII